MGWMFAKLFLRGVSGIRQRGAHKHQTDNQSKDARGEATARMSVGKRRKIAAGCKNARMEAVCTALATMGSREVHTDRSCAHYAAAAFAVVQGSRRFAAAVLQCGEAGGSRSTAAEKFFLLEQPARFCVTGGNQPGILLSHEPARVRAVSGTEKVRLQALQGRRDMRREQGLGGENGHLGWL